MNTPKTLYISDLDGTLLGADGRLSEDSVRLLNDAINRGALFSIATARTPATVSTLMRGVDLRVPLVVMTGAALWDISRGRYSEVQHFTPEQVREVIEAYTSVEGGGAFLYTLRELKGESLKGKEGRRGMEIYHIGPFNEVERTFMMERVDSPFKRFFVSETGESRVPDSISDAVLFFGMRPNAVAEKIIANLEKIEDINPMHYHDWFGPDITEIEAFPRGATKAQAVMRLKKLTGADRVVVFGDNMNDLSMMAVADVSVAVANAIPEVREAADVVIGPNTEDSVAKFIRDEVE